MNIVFYTDLGSVSWKDMQHKILCISKAEADKVLSYKQEKDRCLALAGKLILLYGFNILMKQNRYILPELEYNEFGKPEFKSYSLGFNISHSGYRVVCACIHQGITGVDIEYMTKINPEEFRDIFSGEEYDRILAGNPVDFFHLWTLKEAVMKAEGRGFSLDPLQIQTHTITNGNELTLNKNRWFLFTKKMDEYSLTLASSNPEPPQYIEVNPRDLLL